MTSGDRWLFRVSLDAENCSSSYLRALVRAGTVPAILTSIAIFFDFPVVVNVSTDLATTERSSNTSVLRNLE